ncbi:MAG TPA: hypothetical protein VGN57_09715 [Pirellulaceae bacterium]|jgi:hypothetical protein|nr:hypothetical protein [Pirellulaceae bacterium]
MPPCGDQVESSRLSRSAPRRDRLSTIVFAAVACSVLLWAIIDQGPGSAAFDLTMHAVAVVALLTCGAVLALTLSGVVFVATFALVCLRGRSLTEAGQAGYRIAGVTLRRCMECASRFML